MYLLFIVFLECPLHGAMTVFFSHGHFCVPAPRTQPGRDAVGCHFCRTTERCSGGCKRQKRRPFWRGGRASSSPAHGPVSSSNLLSSFLSQELAWGDAVLFSLASLAFSAAVAKTRSSGTADRRSGAAPRGTSPTALGGRAGHAQSAGPLQLSE